jgi:lysophospholipase L1-like esterase
MSRFLALLAAALVGVAYLHGAPPDGHAPGRTHRHRTVVLAALGDSITTAAGTCATFLRCPDNSWATGTRVVSVLRRLRAARPDADIEAVNAAEPGAGVDDLAAEAVEAVDRKADYVTILIGANDACWRPALTARDFRASLDEALAVLEEGRPRARVEMLSIPDVGQLWTIPHRNPVAQLIWRLKECPTMMTNATSTASADVHRRRGVMRRIDAYDRELAAACRAYPHHRCHFDGERTHRLRFTMAMVGVDYFHPSIRGQQELARTPLPSSWTA